MGQQPTFARYYNAEFPCQNDCAYDYNPSCPSMWRETSNKLCEAPAHYIGACSSHMNPSEMSEKDKYTFRIHCGARWLCVPTNLRSCFYYFCSQHISGHTGIHVHTMPMTSLRRVPTVPTQHCARKLASHMSNHSVRVSVDPF